MNRLLICLLFIFISCNLPEPTSPNTDWTQIDEYPIYNQCPVDDVNSNWSCFTKMIEKKIDKKINQKNISISNLDETVYLKLNIDTLGVITLIETEETNKNKNFFNAVQEVFNSLGPLTPAFKTNLEIPVKAQLTIPIQILK
ncbi:MAG: hypothetical protein VXV80_00170 [Bacteroidota bacterium]|nr:hypothetical protein [Bacteroidota bacterium]